MEVSEWKRAEKTHNQNLFESLKLKSAVSMQMHKFPFLIAGGGPP